MGRLSQVKREQSFSDHIRRSWKSSNSLLCVGIDPRLDQLPSSFKQDKQKVFDYCRRIVEATHRYACAFKPNVAFFSALGLEDELAELIVFIHTNHPATPVLLDAKRGDIASTAELYAVEVFERFGADAVTVSPFLGWDCVEPFLHHQGRGVFVLCRTSNPGSDWIQKDSSNKAVYQLIAEKVSSLDDPNIGLVAGATHLSELAEIRAIAPQANFLIPGVGSQGGSAEEVLRVAINHEGSGVLVNVSRGLLPDRNVDDYFDQITLAAKKYASQLTVIAK